ncbi:lysophospholipid acyltransferase family protein [Sphingobacterium hotanense]|uniref:lysophospholipid acyltransferase family protein n=1 Tax=Sphingobacterium hotanense TaxID=649196 RepID=UPI0021A5F9C9|nr:lysophospholipid acyltransferase family protein [Sphingobacterium hotanense]MCT1525195.1 lysophospholipid acyltransferase family protein [Sphingobacterium hotanense]
MSQWDGKSKGTLLGYQIFVNIIKKLGVRAAYGLLIPVALYYVLAYPKTAKAMFYYYRKRQGFPFIKSILALYKGYFVFGQVLIDKFALFAGLRNRFTFDFDGIDILKQLLDEKKGGILISGHIGNFEIAEKFFADIDLNQQIHIVAADQERTVIKDYLSSISKDNSHINFIHIREDMSHIFEISAALANNDLICLTGDRYFDNSKTLSANLLGEDALFPAGTFMIASRLNAPIAFVYVMKEPNLHYHLYTRRVPAVKHRDAQAVLNAYTQSMEQMLKKYPYQWFNFFDFWKAENKD